MHVFTDEFLAVITKRVADRQREDDTKYIVLTDEFIATISKRVIEQQRGLAQWKSVKKAKFMTT